MKEYQIASSLEDLKPYSKDGYDGFFLMKYTSTYKYQQEFLDGLLYFNTSDYFSKCEKEGQGDETENLAWKINPERHGFYSARPIRCNNQMMIAIIDYSEHPEGFKPGTVFSYSPAEYRFRKLISFYTVYTDSIDNRVYPFPDNLETTFGKYGILITNPLEFYKRVVSGLQHTEETIKNPQLGYVDYMSPEEEQGLIEYSPFIKPSRFNEYNEFRITFIGDDNNAKKIDIGYTLRDICFPIYEGGYKEMFILEKTFHFPKYSECNLGGAVDITVQ